MRKREEDRDRRFNRKVAADLKDFRDTMLECGVSPDEELPKALALVRQQYMTPSEKAVEAREEIRRTMGAAFGLA